MSEQMRVVAMDEDKERLVVFRFVSEDAPDMYVFVNLEETDPEKCCRVENVTEFPRYGDWTGEGMYVGNYFPQDKVDAALELMTGKCKQYVQDGIERFREDMRLREEHGEFDRLQEWEKEIDDGIEMVKKDELGANMYNGIGYF